MAILGEACNIHRPNAGAKDATDSPLPPSYEDDVTATTDGKEQTTWPAAAGDAEDDDTKQPLPPPPPPPPEKTYSEDDVVDFPEVLRFCRPGPSVELLAVYPYFPFPLHNIDPDGNLVLTGPFVTISGFGSAVMKIEIPGIFGYIYTVDTVADDKFEDYLITVHNGRRLVVTFVTMMEGLGVGVQVSLRLFGGGDDAFHTIIVHGQITVHNRIFGDDSVLLFLHREEEKVQLTPSAGGDRDPEVSLNVTSPSNEGANIAFEGDVEFPLDMAQRVRAIHTEHGDVQVRISYN
ncbi:hypothetical protein VPH35_099881 [Triticum aestivum]